MNMDTLKTAWDASVSQFPDAAGIVRLTHVARARARKYEHAALLRLIFGSAAFGLALAMLAALAMVPEIWLGMRVAMVVWSASIIGCVGRLWRIRAGTPVYRDAPLVEYMESCLRHIHREIAYQRSLRWWWWVPVGIGLLAAMVGRLPATPDISWLFPAACAGVWMWGFIHGPRYWPDRLLPEAETLQSMLERLSANQENRYSR